MQEVPTIPYNYANMLPPGEIPRGHNLGFAIQTLSEGQRGQPLPVEAVIASSRDMGADLLARFQTGDGARIIEDKADAQPTERFDEPWITIDIPQSTYDQAVAEGAVLSNIESGRRTEWISGENADRLGVQQHFGEMGRDKLTQYIENQALHFYDADTRILRADVRAAAQEISQVFEFSAWGRSVRLYNFTRTLVTPRQLEKMCNSLREAADLTGGTAVDILGVVAIAPANLAAFDKGDVTAFTWHTSIVISEETLQKDAKADEAKPMRSPYAANTVGDGEVGTMFYHELIHAVAGGALYDDDERTYGEAIGWTFKVDSNGYRDRNHPGRYLGRTPHPTAHGRKNVSEDISETATARFVGGQWEKAIDDERRHAIEGLWHARHSQRQGPTFVQCKELDLHNLPRKFGLTLRRPVAFAPHYNYHIIQEEPQLLFGAPVTQR